MLARTSGIVTLALLAIVLGAITGCAAKAPVPAVPTGTSQGLTTASPDPSGSPSSSAASEPSSPDPGPISTPSAGSAQRAAIIKAVASALGLKSDVVVSQLFAQDGAAVGDLHTPAGQRVFFGVTGGPSSWKLVWSAPFGSATAKAADLFASDPGSFGELAKVIDFKKALAKPKVAPTVAGFETYTLKSATELAGTTYTGTFGIKAKIAKDSKGTWWGNGVAEPSDTGLESIGVWARWDGKAWIGEIADFSTDGAEAAYFPADVLPKLAL